MRLLNKIKFCDKKHIIVDQDSHEYKLALPSVSKLIDFKFGNDWKEKIPTQKLKEAAELGTKYHTYMERYIKEGNEFLTKLESLDDREVIEKTSKDLEIVLGDANGNDIHLYTEFSFISKLYTGTLDLLVIGNNRFCIIDYKFSNVEQLEKWKYQLCAYLVGLTDNRELASFIGNALDNSVVELCIIRYDKKSKKSYRYQFPINKIEFDKVADTIMNDSKRFHDLLCEGDE